MIIKKIIAATTLTGLLAATTLVASASPASVYGDLTGMTEDEAKAVARENETTFALLADEQGLLDEYKAGLIDDMTEKIQSAVEDGKLTEDEANEKIAELTEYITNANAEDLKHKLGRKGGRGQKGDRNLSTVLENQFDGDFDALKADILTKHTERISQAVEEEKLTAEEAAEKTEALESALNSSTDVDSLEEALKALRPEKTNDGMGAGKRGQLKQGDGNFSKDGSNRGGFNRGTRPFNKDGDTQPESQPQPSDLLDI